jgi:tetratricopeptide (TPR) repeat protein
MKLQISAKQNAAVENALRQAAAALQAGRAQEAERGANHVLAQHRKHPGASQLLGMALLDQNRAGEAIGPLQDALRARPNAAAETYLAKAFRRTGRSPEALTLLQQAIVRQPPLPHAFFELGTLFYEQGRLPEALDMLERGMKIAPQIIEFSLVIGNICIDLGRCNRAETAFARVLVGAPGHSEALRGLGCAFMGRGDFARAAERLTRALASNPNDARAQLLLASCLFELGKADEAVERLRSLVRTTPQLIGQAVKAMTEAGRGRLWLKPSAAAEFLGLKNV